ncbi:MAG: tRNA (N6-isopentenyl adenosine(37)-C2)-methylthiotransferase MiaB [Oscillospiraceae bacterium]|nr:tRNA (N6-isopentenyl adenosine(37)-C2)-methylthiotransferase MiaB [Oscillospiraceae bacterium]
MPVRELTAAQTEEIHRYTAKLRDVVSLLYPYGASVQIRTYGCQGNEADSERMMGLLRQAGFTAYDQTGTSLPDLVIFNTCAIREHAADRVFGNVGRLKETRAANRNMRVAVCGCLAQQKGIAEKLRQTFPFVDIVFGTHALHQLPELLYRSLTGERRVTQVAESDGIIAEGIPAERAIPYKAFLPIMYGCNNFCSYCVVPFVRGRERSRRPEVIYKEAEALLQDGVKDLTLIGQNVNSYRGQSESDGQARRFPDLLRHVAGMDGDFVLRFMTSHPKDCTEELLKTMAAMPCIGNHIHLPVQAGSDSILEQMRRGYTAGQYLSLLHRAKTIVRDLAVTSDIIVGFPGETYDDFKQTLDLVREARFANLFTFIYSPREGTKAALLPDPVPHSEKVKWLQELTALQEEIGSAECRSLIGATRRVLVEGAGHKRTNAGRAADHRVTEFGGEALVPGTFTNITVTAADRLMTFGEIISA